jgi:hypothetical protein
MLPEITRDETHTYRARGRIVPGVTRALMAIDELDGIPREMLEAAANFGRHVHKACHLFNQGMLDEEALDAPLVPYLAGYRKFLADTTARVIHSERMVYHRKVGYAGELDLTAIWGRHALPAVIDIKTSAAVPRSVGPQTAMYREAYISEGNKASKTRYCLHLKDNGDYRLHEYNDPRDWNIALSCLNVWNWMNANAST